MNFNSIYVDANDSMKYPYNYQMNIINVS